MNVHTTPNLNSRINAYLEETGPLDTATLRAIKTELRALSQDGRRHLFKQLRIRKIKGEFAQRRLVTVLFALGEHLEWQQSKTFSLLKHSWERNSTDGGYADMMLRCLSELNLRSW